MSDLPVSPVNGEEVTAHSQMLERERSVSASLLKIIPPHLRNRTTPESDAFWTRLEKEYSK